MNLQDWLKKWGMTGLSINAGFLKMEWKPEVADREAAWDLYIELLTRVTTQRLAPEDGDEATALDSVYSLFALTRETLKHHGRQADSFAKIAIVVLNQVIRPFTAKWHREKLAGAFSKADKCEEFRRELDLLQAELRKYSKMLADMAAVEDLTELETTAD